MAPLDVITAQSQLASDQQALVQAQNTQLQDETTLLVAITKDPLARLNREHRNRSYHADSHAGLRSKIFRSQQAVAGSLAETPRTSASRTEPKKCPG